MNTEELKRNLSVINSAKPVLQSENTTLERYFVGREQEINVLNDWFFKQNKRIAVLYGIGGIGKTTLAKRFVQSSNLLCPRTIVFEDKQDATIKNLLLQIDYSSEVIAQYAQVASQDKDLALNILGNAVKKLSDNVILLIDNVNNLNEKFINSLLELFQCKILITTRKKLTLPCEILNKEITELDVSVTAKIFKNYYSSFEPNDLQYFEKHIHNEFLGNTQAIIWIAQMLNEQNISLKNYCEKSEIYLKKNAFNGDIHGNNKFDTIANNLCSFLKITDFADIISDAVSQKILSLLAIYKQFQISEKFLIDVLALQSSNEIIRLTNLGLLNRYKSANNDYILTMHPMIAQTLILYGLHIDSSDCKIVIEYVQSLIASGKLTERYDYLTDLQNITNSMQSIIDKVSNTKAQKENVNKEITNTNEFVIENATEEGLDILDILLDEENTRPLLLKDNNGRKFIFEQIAVIPYDEKIYCVLKPLDRIDNIKDDEAIVFYVDESDDSDVPKLMVETNEEVAYAVFLEYYNLILDSLKDSL